MNTWPEELACCELDWCFYRELYYSSEKFYDALAKSAKSVEDLETLAKWNPFRIVLENPSLWMAYVSRDGSGNYKWTKFEADNSKNFTAFELLLKSHNYFISDKTPTNHNFLEGVDFVGEHEDGSPMYCLSCGS